MAEDHDRIDLAELGVAEPDERSGRRRLPYALLAAAGVGVATACAALASFAVASGGQAEPHSPPVVNQVNDHKSTAAPSSSPSGTDSPADSGGTSAPADPSNRANP